MNDKTLKFTLAGMAVFVVLAYLVWLVAVYVKYQNTVEDMKTQWKAWMNEPLKEHAANS